MEPRAQSESHYEFTLADFLKIVVREHGVEALARFDTLFPTLSASDQPSALVTPDGVTLRVLAGTEGQDELATLVMSDVGSRYLDPLGRRLRGDGLRGEEVAVRLTREMMQRCREYRLEKLDGGGAGRG